MKICGMIGSPNKKGNVDLLVSQVLKGASSKGAEVIKLYLNDMNIQACQSCDIDPYPNYCIYKDDMELVYSALESCDAIVLGSPVYFDTVSAQTKLIIDRCNCLMRYIKKPDGTADFERRLKKSKKGIFIAAAGVDQDFSIIRVTVNGFFIWANIELVDTILYAHDDCELGGVKNNPQVMEQAFEAGVKVVDF